MQKHIELLGLKAKDKVTGFKGVISSISFDLYGCVQAAITPTTNSSGEIKNGQWFDVTRLKITSSKPVMDIPYFNQGYEATGKKRRSRKAITITETMRNEMH